MAVLDVLRLVVGVAILSYGSVRDLRTRRVPNRTWLVGGAIGAFLLLIDVTVYDRIDSAYLLLAPLVVVLAYAFWYIHLIAGGADAKALMMLAVLVPYPYGFEGPLGAWPLWPSVLPPTAVTFANSLLVFVAVPFLFFAYNLIRGDLRFPTMFLGYRMELDHAERSFVWISERIDEAGRTRQLLMSSRLSPEEEAQNVARLRAAGRTRVWVTPKIPFMVPLLGGFVASAVLGDVFTKLLTLTLFRGLV